MELDLSLELATAVEPSQRVLQVAGMFGLGVDHDRTITLVPPVRVTLNPGAVVFITGPSGSGKSSLLRLIATALADRTDVRVLRFEQLPALPDRPLVDCFENLSLEETLRALSLAGLNDAFVMLRKPGELSDGQRYRLRLAQAIAMTQSQVDRDDPPAFTVVLADEFGATLDRLTAAIIARNIRRWTRREPASQSVCFIAATTHDDLLEALEPDVLIEKHLGEGIDVVTRASQCGAHEEER